MTIAAPAPASRAERTRHALLLAGLDLLVARPIDAIPIDDIVSAAGVAKGSFFNHFTDKQAFGAAVAALVRAGLETRIDAVNAGVENPVERLANGMATAAEFALVERRQAIVMLRGMANATARNNALNHGIAADIALCVATGSTLPEARTSGVLYWLGLCQVLMVNIAEDNLDRPAALQRLSDMLMLGLSGLGILPATAAAVTTRVVDRCASAKAP
jgi:AcrR family transcriptional regulator